MSASADQGSQKIKCLVIQLTRLGDSIQSLMALRAAQQLYPNLEITFVAHEKFAKASQCTPWIKRTYVMPTEALLNPILQSKKSILESVPDFAAWLEPLTETPWDMVINWSYSTPSSFLTALIPAKIKLGYTRKNDKTPHTLDGWSHYIQSIVQSDIHQGIHLTDIFTTQLLTSLQIHYGEPKDPGDATVTSKSFFTLGEKQIIHKDWNKPGIRWIAIQLGASTPEKQFDIEGWAKLCAMIIRRHDEYRFILLGNQNEISLQREFEDHILKEISVHTMNERIISKVGQSTFEYWAQIIADSQWVFTADTSAVHLASVLGTRVFNLSCGNVRFSETGPYGNGHYIVKSQNVEAIYAAWTYAATEWRHQRSISIESHFEKLEIKSKLNEIEIFRSKIRSADQGGGVYYERITKKAMNLETWTSIVLSHIAREWYCGWTPPVGQELERETLSPELIQVMRKLQEGIVVLEQICTEAIRSADQLHLKTKNLKSEKLMKLEDRSNIQELGAKLSELESLIHRVGNAQDPLLAFSRMIKVILHCLSGEKISELSEETAHAYRFLKIGILSMRNWIEHTLKIAKPVAVIEPSADVIQLKSEINPRSKL